MKIINLIIVTILLFLLAGCSTLKPVNFEKSDVKLDPVNFFVGKTSSSGVMENHGGKPTARITTKTEGFMKDDILNIEQDLYPENGKKNHRSWKLHRIDEHHVDATANDIEGTAHGLLYGNEFSWSFRLKISDRKFIRHVNMSQFMYLMPDGKTLIIRSIIRKFGIIVTQITEQFKKD